MSLTTNMRNRLMDNINVAVDAIGVAADTKMPKPKTKSNRGPIAWKYFIAWQVCARAKARLEEAKKEAIQSGVIFDHEKHPRDPGTNEQVYADEFVAVWLTVRNPATRVNADKMAEYLIAKGVDAKLIADAYAEATSKSRPAHEFRVSLIAVDTPSK